MLLWEIKAQSLKLMFASSDVQYSEAEFLNGSLLADANTGEKLVRMNDSIRRAIDIYYTYVGEVTRFADYLLDESGGSKINSLTPTAVDFGVPSRIDVLLYTDINGVSTLSGKTDFVNYVYDPFAKKIFFIDVDYTKYYTDYTGITVKFRVWYKTKKLNIPLAVNEMTYDLDSIYIPEEIQRKIPFYVKGELFEQDEVNIAMAAKNEYFSFCASQKKPIANVRTKVKRAPVFNK